MITQHLIRDGQGTGLSPPHLPVVCHRCVSVLLYDVHIIKLHPEHFVNKTCDCINERRRREGQGVEDADGVSLGVCPPPQPTK